MDKVLLLDMQLFANNNCRSLCNEEQCLRMWWAVTCRKEGYEVVILRMQWV